MAGPVYNFVWLFLCTLYPAYASFKAVKTKNVKEYVKCMMYWIVFALFSAVESLTDPLGSIFVPFYSEMKILVLLYLSLPLTRGSGVVYRRWVHPLLCSREEEIDKMLDALQEQGVSTAKLYLGRAAHYLGGLIVNTAVRGGGGLVQTLRNSYSLTDLSQGLEWSRGRFTDLTEESGRYSRAEVDQVVATPGMRRRAVMVAGGAGGGGGGPYGDRGPVMMGAGRVMSSESLSSGYSTDQQYLPVDTENLDTEDYELWERRYHSPPPQPLHRQREWRQPPSQREEETFYESYQTPGGRPQLQPHLQARVTETPDSACVTSPYPASEYSDWESEGGEKTPTRAKDSSSLTVQELQAAALKLNLCLVTPQPQSPPMSPPMSPTMPANMAPTMSPVMTRNMPPTMPASMPARVTASPPPVVPPRQRTEVESESGAPGNDISQCESTPTLSSVENKTVSQPSVGLRTTLVEAEKVQEVLIEAEPERSLLKGVSETSLTNPFYEEAAEKISESSETIKAQGTSEEPGEPGERKPRSSKKTRAPAPPVPQPAPSLLSPSDQIIHLSPSVSPPSSRRNDGLEDIEITPEPEAPVISASLGAENGKIIYRSKGFSEETILADTLPQKVELVTPPSPSILPEYSPHVLPETKLVTDPFPDKEWKFLGHSDIEDKDLLKPVPDTLYSRERDSPSESYPTVSASTRLFTYSPSTGLTKLRKYDLDLQYSRPSSFPVRGERQASPLLDRPERAEPPLSPLLPRSEYYGAGEETTSRCPHCTIHTWLPHSPGCLNKRK